MALDLSPEKRQAYAQRFIISGVREGLSGNAILLTLRDLGLGYRTQNFYSDYNRYKDTAPRLPRVNISELNTFLDSKAMLSIPTTGGQRYQYVYSAQSLNLNTGESENRTFSIVSSRRLIGSVADSLIRTSVDFTQSGFSPDMSSLEFEGENNFFSILP